MNDFVEWISLAYYFTVLAVLLISGTCSLAAVVLKDKVGKVTCIGSASLFINAVCTTNHSTVKL